MGRPSAHRAGRLACLVAALVSASVGGVALGAPTDEDIAKAKLRFEEGKTLEDANKWADALSAFHEVAAIKMTPQVRFQIAYCEENLGRWLAAIKGYDEAVALGQEDEERAKDVLRAAPERRDALHPRVPRIDIDLTGPGAEGATHFSILVDGVPVEADALHLPIEVDVGPHTIDLETGSDAAKQTKHIAAVTLEERQERKVRVEVPLLDAGGASVPEGPTPGPSKQGTKIPAIVVGSVGIASLVGSAVFLGLRQDAISQVRDSCKNPANDTGCNPKLIPTANQGQTYTYVSASLAGVGAAALGTAVVLWFTVGGKHASASPAPTSVVLSPAFVGVVGRF